MNTRNLINKPTYIFKKNTPNASKSKNNKNIFSLNNYNRIFSKTPEIKSSNDFPSLRLDTEEDIKGNEKLPKIIVKNPSHLKNEHNNSAFAKHNDLVKISFLIFLKLKRIHTEVDTDIHDYKKLKKNHHSLSQQLLRKSQNSTCLTPSDSKSNSDDLKEPPVENRRRRKSTKKLKKLNFLSTSTKSKKKRFAFTNISTDSPFISTNSQKYKVSPNLGNSYKGKQLRKNNSFLVRNVSRASFESQSKQKNPRESLNPPIQNIKGKSLKMLQEGLKKKMKIRHSARTMQGFNPAVQKPNQDRKLAFEFNVGNTNIKSYAVADGHGKNS